jgi:hypothetical protein
MIVKVDDKELAIYSIQRVTSEEANAIIETKEPIGRFIVSNESEITGIDNTDGEAWTEDFESEQKCVTWLVGGDKEEGDDTPQDFDVEMSYGIGFTVKVKGATSKFEAIERAKQMVSEVMVLETGNVDAGSLEFEDVNYCEVAK